jgi:hypothetical protein
VCPPPRGPTAPFQIWSSCLTFYQRVTAAISVLGAIFPRPELAARTRGCEVRARIFPVVPTPARPPFLLSSRPPARTPTTVRTLSVVALELNQPRGRGRRTAPAASLIRAGKAETRVNSESSGNEGKRGRGRGGKRPHEGSRIRGRSDCDRSDMRGRERSSNTERERNFHPRECRRLFAPALPRGPRFEEHRGAGGGGGGGSRGKTDAREFHRSGTKNSLRGTSAAAAAEVSLRGSIPVSRRGSP